MFSVIPKWSTRARASLPMIFRALQPVDVYVEDTGISDEPFYRELLNSAMKGQKIVAHVFGLGGRDKVIEKAQNHDQKTRPALFIIDGDLPWVRGEPIPNIVGLHCHDAYCVENIILCKDALAQLVSQDLAIGRESAAERLAYDKLIDSIQSPLLKLFSAFATVTKLLIERPVTVSEGTHGLCTYNQANKRLELDQVRVESKRDKLLRDATQTMSPDIVNRTYQEILDRLEKLPNPCRAVSGKDFLLTLILSHLSSLGVKQLKRDTLRMRLVAMGDIDRFNPLAAALTQAAKGGYV